MTAARTDVHAGAKVEIQLCVSVRSARRRALSASSWRTTAMPAELEKQFDRIEDLGKREIIYRGRALHEIHLYACRNLRAQAASSVRERDTSGALTASIT